VQKKIFNGFIIVKNIKTKLVQFLFVVKATTLKLQILELRLQVQSTDASHHTFISVSGLSKT